MKKEEKFEVNRLIVDFMGIYVKKWLLFWYVYDVNNNVITDGWTEKGAWDNFLSNKDLTSSWDCIMPIWDKISKIVSNKYEIREMEISKNSCWIKAVTIPYNKSKSFCEFEIIDEINNTLFQTVCRTIIKFILWYNKLEN